MEWVTSYISAPIRRFLGMFFSIYPVAIAEILITIAVLFLIYYLIKAVVDSWRRRGRWKILGKRMLWLLVAVCYIYSAFCWLWTGGYYTRGFAERNGFVGEGVETADLIEVTQLFADKVNELSVQLERDEDGYLVINRSEMLSQSRHIYDNLQQEFPSLKGTVYAPKPMYLYSWLMTATRYTGVYLALTGESMINIQNPASDMPSTVAHEIAHQLGVYREDEATLVGILACVTSENPLFEYSGYVDGLGNLLGALAGADPEAWDKIQSGLTDEYWLDKHHYWMFWMNAGKSNTGIDFLDNFFTNVMETTNDVVDAVYEDFLVSQGQQEHGLQTYGLYVDMLVEYFTRHKLT